MTAATVEGFAMAVHYLTGYAAAALPTGQPEWPPHPARLFMALVAACHQTGSDPDELAALRWLEQQPPPEVIASACDNRGTVTVFVPPNDFTSRDPNIIPQWRTKRQPRTFPRVRPHDERVDFVWPVPPPNREALARLCEKVARLGHSSSLVQIWLHDDPIEVAGRDRYRPGDAGSCRLRGINPGSLDYLDQIYREADIEDHFQMTAVIHASKDKAKKQAESAYQKRFDRPWKRSTPPPERLRPEMSAAVVYEQVIDGSLIRNSCFDPSLVMLRLSPRDSRFRRLAASSAPRVCDVFRRAAVKHAPDDLALVCGHTADGSPLKSPHMAVLPLPFAGARHADGHLLGLAVALPRPDQITKKDRAAAIDAIRKVDHLMLGDLGVWNIGLVPFDDERYSLQSRWWSGPDQGTVCWATVTPIALDRHPKSKDPVEQQDETADLIRRACEAIQLPTPSRVVPFPVSVFGGVPDAGRFLRLARKDGSKRRQTHAMLWFDQPVVGPVLLGAGRFRGWGVCRPYREGA